MSLSVHSFLLGLVIVALLLSGLTIRVDAQKAGPSNGAPSERQIIGYLLQTLVAGDSVVLKDGCAFSGTVQADQFQFLSDTGQQNKPSTGATWA